MSEITLTPQNEIWKTISEPSLKGLYSVSNLGRVRRNALPIVNCRGVEKTYPQHVLRPSTTRHGYLMVVLCAGRKHHYRYVHILVCREFSGASPGVHGRGHGTWQVDHIDGTKTNNTPSNLQWVEFAEHCNLTARRGQCVRGEKHPNVRFSDADVCEMRRLRVTGLTFAAIAERFATEKSCTHRIITNKSRVANCRELSTEIGEPS